MAKTKTPQTVPELYAEHEALRAQAKELYEQADKILARLIGAWKKNRAALVDGKQLEIEDKFKGQVKCFAPGFAHRYNLKLRTADPD